MSIVEVWVDGTSHSVDTESQDALDYFTRDHLKKFYPNWTGLRHWLKTDGAMMTRIANAAAGEAKVGIVVTYLMDALRQGDYEDVVTFAGQMDALVTFTSEEKSALNAKCYDCWIDDIFS